jgi:hypothetical protein
MANLGTNGKAVHPAIFIQLRDQNNCSSRNISSAGDGVSVRVGVRVRVTLTALTLTAGDGVNGRLSYIYIWGRWLAV